MPRENRRKPSKPHNRVRKRVLLRERDSTTTLERSSRSEARERVGRIMFRGGECKLELNVRF